MSRCAVYAATRNLYNDLQPSIKSLMANSDVEKVYVLIEDDALPYNVPKEVVCINVSKQRTFRAMGPNMVYPYAYISMLRVALCNLLKEEDHVLSLDVDVIIDGDISELWDLPLDDYYFAAVPEPAKSKAGRLYTNTGVAVFNLAKLRDGKSDEMVKALNWQRYMFLDQDCLNERCQGHILSIPSTYNATAFTEPVENPRIVHYAGVRDWTHEPLVEKYRAIEWGDIRKPRRGRKPFATQKTLHDDTENIIPRDDLFGPDGANLD